MRLQFLNREREIVRLERMRGSTGALGVVYGRRRCGKSTLLQRVARSQDIYYAADQRDATLQIQGLAAEVARSIPGFDQVGYPSWEALWQTLNARAAPGICLILDEFPYLVHATPELPSLVQKWVDDQDNKVNLILCGSSQRMMQGLVLGPSEPLYGRAQEIIKIAPLEPGWISDALGLKWVESIEAYSVWGGVPRYWELARSYATLETGVKDLVLDRNGVLHEEPTRLLLDDMRTSTQAHSLLELIANGCHRLSEIAGRIGRRATDLSRPLAQLIELGYIRREIPFGESPKSSKRSIYKVDDPFLTFWYSHVQKYRSLLERDLIDEVYGELTGTFSHHVGAVWEDLARKAVANMPLAGKRWKPGQRWWGTGLNGKMMEIDLVAESLDGSSLLLGEVKWEDDTDVGATRSLSERRAANFPRAEGRDIVLSYWLKKRKGRKSTRHIEVQPEDVLTVLR